MIALALFACSTEPAAPAPPPAGFFPVEVSAIVDEMAAEQAKPRVYNFWATWCGPCMRELPALRSVAASRDDFELVLVNVDLPDLHDTKVRPAMKRLDLEGLRNLALVSTDPAGDMLQVEDWPSTLPVTMIVRPDGTKAQQFNVGITAKRLNAALDDLSR
jgi:thiol-disulfide isomerase/thioredoxin